MDAGAGAIDHIRVWALAFSRGANFVWLALDTGAIGVWCGARAATDRANTFSLTATLDAGGADNPTGKTGNANASLAQTISMGPAVIEFTVVSQIIGR